MTGRTVWLASYPKSGNTWVRAIVTALSTHSHLFQVNQLDAGAQPFSVVGALPQLGLDSRWLSYDENDRLRAGLIRSSGADRGTVPDRDDLAPTRSSRCYARRTKCGDPAPRRRTVSRRCHPSGDPRRCRDPRDVACSYAPFFGVGIDAAIDTMGKPT